ncbi:MAG: GntR family transcriptional regulator [Proteobacteria bacterium]|nr:GntR family transcriptional regulator [Pseudomonadota bacterium]MBS0549802.1 GntR family transcriptional regulator [Pseudomonadota bacterium]
MIDLDIGDAHSLGEFMLQRLRADIISTELEPGSKLALHRLARRYGIGITPLREALGQLAGDGLVVMESQKGFRVAPVSQGDLRDLCDIRLKIELIALDMAFDRADTGWDERMRRALDAFVGIRARVGDDGPINGEWERTHRELHMATMSVGHSPTLSRMCTQIYDRIHRYRRIALPTKSYMGGISEDHLEINKAAHARDRSTCRALLERHIVESNRLIEENFQPPERN